MADTIVAVETTADNTSTIKENINGDKIWSPRAPLANLVEALSAAGKIAPANNSRTFSTLTEYPVRFDVKVTVAANAAATSITVDDASMVVKNMTFFDRKSGQTIYCRETPSTTTSIPVVALSSSISAGTYLQRSAEHAPENHTRTVPRSRGGDRITHRISKFMDAVGCTFEDMWLERYGGMTTVMRLDEQLRNRLSMAQEQILWWDREASAGGTDSDLVITKGIYQMAEEYGYAWAPGVINTEWLYTQAARLKKNNTSGSGANILILCSSEMVFKFAAALTKTGNMRYSDVEKQVYGYTEPKIVLPLGGVQFKFLPCEILDVPGYSNFLIGMNPQNFRVPDYGKTIITKPTAADPNGAANKGTGQVMTQIVKYLGLACVWPQGSIFLGENIKGVRV